METVKEKKGTRVVDSATVIQRLRAAGVLADVEAIAARRNTTAHDICGKVRQPALVLARWESWEAVRAKLDLEAGQLGELFDRPAQSIREGLDKLPGMLATRQAAEEAATTRMRHGLGERYDDTSRTPCLDFDDCILEFGKAHATADACHCPAGCPFFEPIPREIGFPTRSGIDMDPGTG